MCTKAGKLVGKVKLQLGGPLGTGRARRRGKGEIKYSMKQVIRITYEQEKEERGKRTS